MKKIGKLLAWLVGIGVVLVVALLVLAKVLISPERVRQTLLPLAEKALHRPVALGNVEVKLLSGITLNQLQVQEPEGGETFVAARSVLLRYQLWPLLAGRVVVDEIRLVEPTIRIVRQEDGSFNFSDLLAGKKEGAEKPAPVAAQPQDKALDLLVSQVAIEGGTLDFFDATLDPQAPYRYQVSSLTVEASDISLTQPFPVEVQASLNAAPLIFKGEVDLRQSSGGGKLTVNGLDVARLAPYFRDKIPGELESLLLSLDLNLNGGVNGGESKGRLILDKLSLNLTAMPDAPLRNAKLVVDYTVKADLSQGVINLSSLKLNYNDVLVPELTGNLTDVKNKPTFDGALSLPATALKPLLAALPPGLVQGLSGLNPSGTIAARLHLAGPLSAGKGLLQDGEIQLDRVQVDVGTLNPALAGTLQLKGENLSARQLQLQAGENIASIDFKAGNLFGKPIRLSSQITSQRFQLDPLLETGAGGASATSEGGGEATVGKKEELGPLDLPLSADGTVRIAQTTYKGLAMEDFQLDYRLENNILTIIKMTGRSAGGSFEQTARIDLGKPGLGYTSQLSIKALQAEPFLRAFAPSLAGKVFGALSMNADVSGSGTQPESLKRNLSATGNLLLNDGRLTGSGMVAELATFLNLPELQEIKFREGKGSFTVKQGKVNLNGDLAAQDVRMAPKGTVGLDGALDVSLDARLAPALTAKLDRKGNVSQFFTDKDGWGEVPLRVTGTAGAPKFAFDASAVKGKVKERVVEEAQKRLQEKVFDKLLPSKEAAPGEPAPSPAKQLQESIKGLFGK